jgi:hypothetical protein
MHVNKTNVFKLLYDCIVRVGIFIDRTDEFIFPGCILITFLATSFHLTRHESVK